MEMETEKKKKKREAVHWQFPLKYYCRRVGIAEGSCGNEHRIRQTRRITKDSEIEETGDEVQIYTAWKGTNRIM